MPADKHKGFFAYSGTLINPLLGSGGVVGTKDDGGDAAETPLVQRANRRLLQKHTQSGFVAILRRG